MSHLEKYRAWLQSQPVSDPATDLAATTSRLLDTPAAPCAVAMMTVLENLVPIWQGQVEPLQILMANNTLLKLYDYLNLVDRSVLFEALGHHRPSQRILEIGAGTGGTTAKVLEHTMYATYTFTDISSAFFPAAKERFRAHRNIAFQVLDITKDPCHQGFQPASFDLIVAANVLHATPSLHETLVNVRKLLHPQGTLLLEELCSETKFTNFVTGILPGWWAGENDGRANEPYTDPLRWEKELKSAGFKGLDKLAFDAAPPFQVNSYIMSSPSTTVHATSERAIIIICDSTSAAVATQFQAILRSRRYHVVLQALDDHVPADTDVLVLVDATSPFFHSLNASNFKRFQSFLRQLQQSHSGALWVTRSSQLSCRDPRFSLSTGVVRTVRSEFGLDFAICEVDTINRTSIGLVVDVFETFLGRCAHGDVLLELEYAIQDSMVHIGRILPSHIRNDAQMIRRLDYGNENIILTSDGNSPGSVESLAWTVGMATESNLEEDQVEIQVNAAGADYSLLRSLGNEHFGDIRLGHEGAGIVQRVGSQVLDLCPGDRVFAIGSGSLAMSMVVPATHCAKIPDELALHDAATMPLAFATAIHCLIDIGKLQPSQSVLIQSVSGGASLAAIQISQMAGAKVFATVGSEEKADYLTKAYDVPPDHIFTSCDSSFLSEIMSATNGHGVDVVLGSHLTRGCYSWSHCVAKHGKLINLYQRGVVEDEPEHESLPRLKTNVSYISVDMADYIQFESKEDTMCLLRRVAQLYEKGCIRPLSPVHTFRADEVKTCLTRIQADEQIGSHVVTLDNQWQQSVQLRLVRPSALKFKTNASYLLAGGLGGLGSGLARWMAERNARHFIFLSRNAGERDADKALFRELESQGCHVGVVKGSVCSPSDVTKAIKSATSPLKGIFNMSMVLSDASVLTMSLAQWTAATEPKVQGTWNLHQASLGHTLDCFILFSSMCGIFGMPGQANYAAANTFMDAFVQYRHQCNLAASVLDLGAVENIGHVAENPHILERSKWLDHFRMSEGEFLEAITLAILNGIPHQEDGGDGGVGPAQIITGFNSATGLSEPLDVKTHLFDSRWAAYFNYHNGTRLKNEVESADELASFLASVASNPDSLSQPFASDFVATQIAKWVFDLLMKPVEQDSEIDISRSLADVSFDSLAAVEMRSWWKRTFEFDISVLEIMSFASFSALGKHAVQGLVNRFRP